MFNHLKHKFIDNGNSFEVYVRATGELLGAIMTDSYTPEQKKKMNYRLPYEVYYKGVHVATEYNSPVAWEVIDKLYKEDLKKRGKLI